MFLRLKRNVYIGGKINFLSFLGDVSMIGRIILFIMIALEALTILLTF